MDGMSNNGAPDCMSETGSCSRWTYEGEVEQWAEVEVERELAGGDECIAGGMGKVCGGRGGGEFGKVVCGWGR